MSEVLKDLAGQYPEVNLVPMFEEGILHGKIDGALTVNALKDKLLMVGMSGRPLVSGGSTLSRNRESEDKLNVLIEGLQLPLLAAPRAMIDPRWLQGEGQEEVHAGGWVLRRSLAVYHTDLMPLRTQAILRAAHAFLTEPVAGVVLRHSGPEQVPNWMRNAIEHALLPYRSFLSVNFGDQQEGEVAVRLLHYSFVEGGSECPMAEEGEDGAQIRTLIYPAFTYSMGTFQKRDISKRDLGSHCGGKDERREMPPLVPPDLPREALRQMRVTARGELPQYVFEACLTHGWENCAPDDASYAGTA